MLGAASELEQQSQINHSDSTVLRDHVAGETQIGVLRDLVLTLLRQLELLDNKSPRQAGYDGSSLQDEVRRFEIELINSALCRTHGHQHRAARLLGVKPTTLNSKIKRYNIMFPFFGVGVQGRDAKV